MIDDCEDDLLHQVLDSGRLVAYQDWDSGGPGAGAGRVSVLEYQTQFYVVHDAGIDGPFESRAKAMASGQVDTVTDATVAIWIEGQDFSYRR